MMMDFSTRLPIHLLGDNVKSNHRYRRATNQRHAQHSLRGKPLYPLVWYPLMDALRRFVIAPFDGPWTKEDERG